MRGCCSAAVGFGREEVLQSNRLEGIRPHLKSLKRRRKRKLCLDVRIS
jgi:hypothetical protein